MLDDNSITSVAVSENFAPTFRIMSILTGLINGRFNNKTVFFINHQKSQSYTYIMFAQP